MRDVPPKTGWLMKAQQKVNKAGWRDIVVEFGTVPPKAGRLRPMVLLFIEIPLAYIFFANTSDSGPVLRWQCSCQPRHSDTGPCHEQSIDSSPVCDSSSRLLHCRWLRRLVQPKWLCSYYLHLKLKCHISSQGELLRGSTQEQWRNGGRGLSGDIPL